MTQALPWRDLHLLGNVMQGKKARKYRNVVRGTYLVDKKS